MHDVQSLAKMWLWTETVAKLAHICTDLGVKIRITSFLCCLNKSYMFRPERFVYVSAIYTVENKEYDS
jgi:hypothetical protein